MTTQALFIQGAGKGAHDEWDNELVQSLQRELGEGYTVLYPRMPQEDDPQFVPWKTALCNEFDSLEDGAVLVGHSVGGTILLHALAERRVTIELRGIFLVAAPFIGPGGWPSADIRTCTDLSQRLPHAVPIFLYHGTDDDIVPVSHVHLYARAIPQATVRTCAGGNHQLNNDMSQVARDIRSLR